MENNTSRDRRLMITKNSILMLVMLVIIFLAIWAWYLDPFTPVTASNTEISAAGTDDIELALPVKVDGVDYFPVDNTEWKHKIEFNDSGYFKNLVKDITSNGEQFAIPNFQASAGLEKGRTVIPDDVWTEGLSSKAALTNDSTLDDDQYNYISLDFYARAKVNSFQVTGGSYLAAGSELGKHIDSSTGDIVGDSSDAKPLTGSNIYRVSSYGGAEGTANAFSSDAIVGAMRVSLQGKPVASISGSDSAITANYASGVEDTLRFLWLPRPDVFLKTDNNADNWRLQTGLQPNDGTAYSKKSYAHTFYEGKYVNTTIKKGLTKKLYYDRYNNNVYDYSTDSDNLFTDCVKSSPNIFKVTKITPSNIGGTAQNPGQYPKLDQSQPIAGDSNVPNNIPFTNNPQYSSRPNYDATRLTSGYYVYKYTLNLWIEGEDAEARRSMKDGMFSLLLELGT